MVKWFENDGRPVDAKKQALGSMYDERDNAVARVHNLFNYRMLHGGEGGGFNDEMIEKYSMDKSAHCERFLLPSLVDTAGNRATADIMHSSKTTLSQAMRLAGYGGALDNDSLRNALLLPAYSHVLEACDDFLHVAHSVGNMWLLPLRSHMKWPHNSLNMRRNALFKDYIDLTLKAFSLGQLSEFFSGEHVVKEYRFHDQGADHDKDFKKSFHAWIEREHLSMYFHDGEVKELWPGHFTSTSRVPSSFEEAEVALCNMAELIQQRNDSLWKASKL